MFRNRAVSLALVGLFLWLSGCTSYRQIEVGEVSHHAKVRVTFTDGERETLDNPWVDGDSIKSYTSESVGKPLGIHQQRVTDTVAFPLDQVAELGAVGTDEVGTVFLTFGILVVLAAALGYAALSASDCWVGC